MCLCVSAWFKELHHSPCTLAGLWQLNAQYQERYKITQLTEERFTAACVKGPCTGWRSAALTLSSVVRNHVKVEFGSVPATSDEGQVSANCNFLNWATKSGWTRVPSNITIHLLPHSHIDPGQSALRLLGCFYGVEFVGWYDTTEYFYTSQVRGIYNQLVQALLDNPSRTWIPEIAVYWERWYKENNDTMKAALKTLFARGQMEFAGGGWTQPDEAIVWSVLFSFEA